MSIVWLRPSLLRLAQGDACTGALPPTLVFDFDHFADNLMGTSGLRFQSIVIPLVH
jgi:hypothetical protein